MSKIVFTLYFKITKIISKYQNNRKQEMRNCYISWDIVIRSPKLLKMIG